MTSQSNGSAWRMAVLVGLLTCAEPAAATPKHLAPLPSATLSLMAARGTSPAAPILIRTFKKEAELEVWKLNREGRYVHLKTFPICRWSGQLGPKRRQGDRQAPEGFYTVAPRQMNPNSAYHLSFDVGYPNAYDRAHGGTGSALMVHGTCSSAGCFAMTDRQVSEIYALAREAFAGGQAAFQFQAYPFRMTAENMARHRQDPNIAFWRQLKEGSDRFEATGEEPAVVVREGRYTFAPSKDPAREAQAAARRAEQEARIAALVTDGVASVRTTYSDGGQHVSFASLLARGVPLGEVSRPEALPLAGREVVLIPARPRKPLPAQPTPVQVAAQGLPPVAAAPSRPVAPTADIPSPLLPPEAAWAKLAPRQGVGPAPVMLASLIPGAENVLPGVLAPQAVRVAVQP